MAPLGCRSGLVGDLKGIRCLASLSWEECGQGRLWIRGQIRSNLSDEELVESSCI